MLVPKRSEITAVQDSRLDNQEASHLLSVFPTSDVVGYARLTCIALTSKQLPCNEPVLVESAEELQALLARAFGPKECQTLLQAVEAGATVQRPLTEEEARRMGFRTFVH